MKLDSKLINFKSGSNLKKLQPESYNRTIQQFNYLHNGTPELKDPFRVQTLVA